MDDCHALVDAKKRKIISIEKPDESEDIVSQLPDNILHHILSLLPTRYAVRTCILSTRWQDLWRSVTNLNFENGSSYNKDQRWNNSFVHFLEKVLLLHSSNVKVFRIVNHDYLDNSRVNSWIYSALERNVQELDLKFRSESELLLPRSLCRCDTLTKLRIDSYCDLRLPALIYLSSLKMLHFVGVKFSDDSSINKLFTGLPVLEELELFRCGWKDIQKATICIPTLRKLTLDLSRTGSLDECHVELCVENLVNLSCISDMTVDLVLGNLPLLVRAIISIESMTRHPEGRKYGANLLNGIQFAKSLKVGEQTLSCLDYGMKDNADFLPTFINLTSLEVDSWVSSISCGALLNLFRNSPLLESFFSKEVHAGAWNRKPFPMCFKLNLKTCSVGEFRGRKAEVNFLKFVLKVCMVLEKIKIHRSDQACWIKLKEVHKELELGPRASKNCVIELGKSLHQERLDRFRAQWKSEGSCG